VVGNAYRLAFWLIAHLVHNPPLLDQIRQEVLPAVEGRTINETYLLEQCPKLDSLFNEILQLTVSSSLARVIIQPTVVVGKLLKPGNKLMVYSTSTRRLASLTNE
jgi:cytochrome P450